MAQLVRHADDAAQLLTLSADERRAWAAAPKAWPAGFTPYVVEMLDRSPEVSAPIRAQMLPCADESTPGCGLDDPLSEEGNSPLRELIHVYPDRVAFCVAETCSAFCRYCFRKRRGRDKGSHFNAAIVDRGIAYIAATPSIRDVLVTGGDPFLVGDDALDRLLTKLRAIPHVEIIRLGTRTPSTLPYRITPELCAMLARHHPLWVNTQFNCAEEITPEARRALANLVDHGIPVGNQAVLLRGVNDAVERMMALSRALMAARVRPYYLFHPHRVAGTDHLRVPVDRGIDIIRRMRGNITGLAIPTFVVDTPSGKIPLMPQHILGRDGNDLILENPRGEIWREKDAYMAPS